MNSQETIKQLVSDHRVVLFMKGTPDFPQCGFSGQIVQILNHYKTKFTAVNVLADPEMRQGIKTYTNWPTIPQLYVDGEFIGGCDIITEMYQNNELAKLLAQPDPVD